MVVDERVTYAVPRLDREKRRAHYRYLTRYYFVLFLLLTVPAVSLLILKQSQDALVILVTLLAGFALGVVFHFAGVWLLGAIDIAITVERDQLSYQFKSRLFSRSRQRAREDVTALRWSGYKSIRVIGRRGEPMGRMVVPTLSESWMALLSRAVRMEFGF